MSDEGKNLNQGNRGCSLGSGNNTLSAASKSAKSLGTFSNYGLGAGDIFLGNHPGITPSQLVTVITEVSNLKSKIDVKNLKKSPLFLFIESCDSKAGGTRNPVYIKNALKAYYASNGEITFRNINWDDVFNMVGEEPDSLFHASLIQRILIDISHKFVTKIPKDIDAYDKYLSRYDAITKYLVEDAKLELKKSSNVSSDNEYNEMGSENE